MSERQPQSDKLSLRRADEDHSLGSWNQVVVAVWRGETRPAAVVDLAAFIAECAARHSGGVCLVQVIEEASPPPNANARKAFAAMHGEQAEHIRRSALVYTKRGFPGAAARAVMTGVVMLNPPRFAHELFAAIPQALSWIEQDLWPKGNPTSATAFRKAVEQLRGIRTMAGRLSAVNAPQGSEVKAFRRA
jgi:hypothetical protein